MRWWRVKLKSVRPARRIVTTLTYSPFMVILRAETGPGIQVRNSDQGKPLTSWLTVPWPLNLERGRRGRLNSSRREVPPARRERERGRVCCHVAGFSFYLRGGGTPHLATASPRSGKWSLKMCPWPGPIIVLYCNASVTL